MTVEINAAFDALREIPARYYCVYGGRRSGKSWALSQLLTRRGVEFPPRKIMVIRKFATTVRLSTWPRTLAAVDEAVGRERCRIRLVDREIHLPGGSVILFSGLDDPEKLKSVEAVTDFWIEEASELDELDFNVLDAGLSTPCDPVPSIWLSFNPVPVIEGARHWLQKRFLQIDHETDTPAVRDDTCVLRTWYRSNHFCPPATVKLLESYRESNPSLWRMWGLGEFTALEGAILSGWDVVSEIPPEARLTGYGLDHGYSQDPAACVAVHRHGRDIWLREVLYADSLMLEEVSEALELGGVRKGVDLVTADSSEPRSNESLRRMGWIVEPADKSTPGGVGSFKRQAALFLQGLRIHVLEGSVNMIRELSTWSWKLSKDGSPLPLVQDGNDHLIDALVYCVFRPRGVLDIADIEGARSDRAPAGRRSIISDTVPVLVYET